MNGKASRNNESCKRKEANSNCALPRKKLKSEGNLLPSAALLSDSDQTDRDEKQDASTLKVNEAFAKRFEHNKKREERHRCTCQFLGDNSN